MSYAISDFLPRERLLITYDPAIDCTPYLLQLGLTKSKTSLVWIAGPLSGLIIQPLIGVIADRSRSKWGRRRPFMVFGSLVVALCLIVLGWTSEIVSIFVKDAEKVISHMPLFVDMNSSPDSGILSGQKQYNRVGGLEYLCSGFLNQRR